MRPGFGLGWRKSVLEGPDHRPFLSRMSAVRTLPPLLKPDLTSFRGTRIDQGGVGACWAFFLTRAVQLHLAANHAQKNVLISPRAAYWMERIEEFADDDPTLIPPMTDSGTDPLIGMRGIQRVGVVSWDDCPYRDDVDLNCTAPPDDTWSYAYDFRGLDWAVVKETGAGRNDAVDQAMRDRIPFGFGMLVDQAFMYNSGQRITSIDGGRLVGGHMLCGLARVDSALIDQFELEHARPGDVLFDNWWGDGSQWGTRDGFGVMSPELFGSTWIDDVVLTKAVPLVQRES